MIKPIYPSPLRALSTMFVQGRPMKKHPYFQHFPDSGTKPTNIVTRCTDDGTIRAAHPVLPPSGNLQIVYGELSSAFIRNILEYLADSERHEEDVWLRDDIRLAWLCVIRADEGSPDPWRFAFWQMFGATPEKVIPTWLERRKFHEALAIPDYDPTLYSPATGAAVPPKPHKAAAPRKEKTA